MENIVKTPAPIAAFIDIGTNAVRLLVVKINKNFSYTIISQEKEVIRLGEQEFKDNLLKPQAMKRAIFICGKFLELAKTYGATEVLAVGTSAIREAINQEEFLQELSQKTGLSVKIISGEEEARLIWLGVSSGIDLKEEKAIFIDLGGGSTEICIGNQYQSFYADSLSLGAIRLTSQFIGEGWAERVETKAYNLMKEVAHYKILPVKKKVREHNAKKAWGSSGTIINLAEIENKLFKKINHEKEGLTLSRKNLKKLAPILCSLSLAERKKLPAINQDRADIIIAGAAIIEAIMEDFGLEEINVSHRELRDGLLIDYLMNFEGYKELQKTPMRNRSVLSLGRSCGFDESHSNTVTALALQLFDSAGRIGLHNLGNDERDLLKYASMLHDVGDFLSFNNHHRHSQYIICNADLLGFDQREIQLIGSIAKYHRKKFPSKKALKASGINAKAKECIAVLSTFLRFAEKLDRSHTGLVKKAEFIKESKSKILLRFYADSDCSFEEWSVKENKQAFFEAFDKELDVKCEIQPNL